MPVQIESLSVEHHPTGFGIDHATPRISWRFASAPDAKDWTQKSYELRLTRDGQTETHTPAKGREGDNVLVPWPGKPLVSRARARIEARAQGSDGKWTEWAALDVEAGLFERADWTAQAVGPPKQTQALKRPERVWKEFEWDGKGGNVRLYATAFGVYVPQLNGKPVTDTVLNPGWTSYKHNHRYQIYDLTPLLQPGRNVLSAYLGAGWYMSPLGSPGGKRGPACLFGDRWGLVAQLEVDEQVLVQTDKSWSYAKSEVLFSEIYDGEHVDSTLIDPEWYKSSESKAEGTVEVIDFVKGKLQVSDAPPVRRIEEKKVVEVIKTKSGKTVFDFGQNLVGWLKINSDLKGTGELLIRHAEVMEHGELGTRPLRSAKAEARIKLGGPTKGWEPKFTFYGFRYAEITGLDNINPDDFSAIIVTSEMRRTGYFSCSHDMINQLHKNVLWSIYGNFLSLPTDCPQRDERLGWTGDIQVFANTANFFFDTSGFLEGWLRDVTAETLEYGGICPEVVPWMNRPYQDSRDVRPMGIWADCTALTPWDLYSFFGDADVLRKNWASMTAWLERGVPRGANRMYSHDHVQFGDWLDPRAPPAYPAHGQTDIFLTCDAFLVYTTQVVAQVAKILGEASADKWAKEYEDLKKIFQDEYITPNGRCMSDTQTALTLALKFHLFPEDKVYRAAERLDHLVRWEVFRISTGFAGTPLILNALAENDLLHVAYRMLQEGDNPSWLYPVSMGATTIWERWDSMLPDGSINPGQMTSFNHYALGSVAHFLHTVVGGLAPSVAPLADAAAPAGWKHATIQPQPGGTVRHAKTAFSSAYGLYRCEWAIEGGRLKVEVEVPPNATASVILPGKGEEVVGSGVRTYDVAWKEDERWPPKPVLGPQNRQPVDKVVL